jgi:hypothetical protein
LNGITYKGDFLDNPSDLVMTIFGIVIIVLVAATFLKVLYKEKQERKKLAPYIDAFIKFMGESRPTCPKDKGYPKATLFRHVWRRAVVLQSHFAETEEEKEVLGKIQEIAARNYYDHAPKNIYGKVLLQITPNQILEYIKREQSKPKNYKQKNTKDLACIYMGIAKDGRIYIGQTFKEPERRWIQHRQMGTGPYKNSSDYVDWKIIRGNLPTTKLDYWESYYIGFYNAYENGYNDTPGNDSNAYDQGKEDSRNKIGISGEEA